MFGRVSCWKSSCRIIEGIYPTSAQRLFSKVPTDPTWTTVNEADLPPSVQVDDAMITHLERLALVDFGNKEGIDRLNKAIRFADQMMLVDTSDVEPMTSVLEDRALYLRDDEVTVTDSRQQLLKLPKKTVEEYYVSPPGNIPLEKFGEKSGEKSGEKFHVVEHQTVSLQKHS